MRERNTLAASLYGNPTSEAMFFRTPRAFFVLLCVSRVRLRAFKYHDRGSLSRAALYGPKRGAATSQQWLFSRFHTHHTNTRIQNSPTHTNNTANNTHTH